MRFGWVIPLAYISDEEVDHLACSLTYKVDYNSLGNFSLFSLFKLQAYELFPTQRLSLSSSERGYL